MDVVLYDIPAWGVGELYFRTDKLLYHELPRAGATPDEQAEHPLAERIRAHFRGERTSFDDVEIEAEWATPFQAAIADALRGIPWGEVVTYGELAAMAGRPRAPAQRALLRREQLPARRPVPPRRLLVRARGLWVAGRRLQAPAARARGRRAVRLSEDVRAELAAIEPRKPCCRLAELSALVRGAGSVHLRGGAVSACTWRWRAARSRGGRSRSCAPTASNARSAPTSGAPSTAARGSRSTWRTTPARFRC